MRWHTCSLCEQTYHGVVQCALGWACWKTYLGRPETDPARLLAMQLLGNGLSAARHHEDALPVREAELAIACGALAHQKKTFSACRDQSCEHVSHAWTGPTCPTYAARRILWTLKIYGEEHEQTLIAANNYAIVLVRLERFKEARSLLRKTIPVARVFSERIMTHAQDEAGFTRRRSTWTPAPRSTISARP